MSNYLSRYLLCRLDQVFTQRMTRKLKIVVSRTRVPAVALSPASTAKKMAKGIVCVLPGMLPATINVAAIVAVKAMVPYGKRD
jgi:hypothetical protein